ncbi:MAG: hypothetical protein JWL86_6608 [Rhizobium sp.]|nr:hypothetical protein [Rhizobium sp.]
MSTVGLKWGEDADVIVVGSGAAGLMAAVEAADAGASVIVLESEAEIGGSTKLSGAYVAFCETPMQPATREELLADLRDAHHEDAQDDLSRLYVDHAGDTFRRLDELGICFVRTFQFAHMSKPWAHELSGDRMGGGAEIISQLEAAAQQRDITIHTSTPRHAALSWKAIASWVCGSPGAMGNTPCEPAGASFWRPEASRAIPN